ncbi:MAG: HDOD domain-containing protein [Mariprofundaceae bacterium]
MFSSIKRGLFNSSGNQNSQAKTQNMFNINLSKKDGVESVQIIPTSSDLNRIKLYHEGIDKIPMPPLLWDEFNTAVTKNASNNKISAIIKSDSVLSAEILKIVNSAAYGLQKPINDIGRAISHLGHTFVRSIVTKHCFSSVFPPKGKLYDLPTLWKHGMAVSALAEIVGKHVKNCDPAEAGSIGLFHDVGRMAFNLFPDLIRTAYLDYEDKGYLQFESERFGCSHVELGEVMATHWKLPEKIKQGIKFHHHPGSEGIEAVPESVRPEVLAVFLGDLLAIHLSFPGGNNGKLLPHESYQHMLKKPLNDIMHEQAVSKELWRVNCIEF